MLNMTEEANLKKIKPKTKSKEKEETIVMVATKTKAVKTFLQVKAI